jgi:cytochrome c553
VNLHVARGRDCIVALMLILGSSLSFAQTDPAARGGPVDPGVRPNAPTQLPGQPQMLPGLTDIEKNVFGESLQRSIQLEAVCDDCTDVMLGTFLDPNKALVATQTNSSGLGDRFNGDQCLVCHSQPQLGGSGGFLVPNPQAPVGAQLPPENPEFRLIPHRRGATNHVPSFIKQFGPVREVRFVDNPDGSPNGGVHQLNTVVGRNDVIPPGQTGSCTDADIAPFDFEGQFRAGNLRFRIPLQLFGLGILDGIQDREITSRHDATAVIRAGLGIQGFPNRSGNDGTITRFGWKAQNKSIALFAAEAYNVEMGVTNDIFTQETDEAPNCNLDKSEPNDITRFDKDDARNQSFFNPDHEPPDWLLFAMFMRFLDAPHPAPFSASAQRGQQLFGTDASNGRTAGIGCVACHTATMVTPPHSETPALENLTAHPFSDLLIHHMGAGLADDITQGAATGDMFRTTPLWGVGQRRFFLHDGRTDNLVTAIEAHASATGPCDAQRQQKGRCYGPSEANTVVTRFNQLPANDQQAIIDFLRAL